MQSPGNAAEVKETQDFDSEFAYRLLEEAMTRLRREYVAIGKEELFTDLHPHIAGHGSPIPRPELAKKHSLEAGTLDVAIHRARRRYGMLLRELLLQLVESEEEVEEELHYLMRALGK
jgi:RNA polymerase sigma-70 factor (ECF subfamily)